MLRFSFSKIQFVYKRIPYLKVDILAYGSNNKIIVK